MRVGLFNPQFFKTLQHLTVTGGFYFPLYISESGWKANQAKAK